MASALYPQTSLSPTVNISVANTNLDGLTGAYGVVATGSTGMDEIDVVYIQATGTTTLGMIRLWLHFQSSNTALATVLVQIVVKAVTPNVSEEQGVWQGSHQFNPPLRLPTGTSLRASTHIGEGFNITAQGVKYT